MTTIISADIFELASDINTIWVLFGAALVFFMQAGFAMVESGFTRAKNAGNIIMKNMMDFCIGAPLYWVVGFGIMFGTCSIEALSGVFGHFDFFILSGDYSSILPDGVNLYAYVIFQTVFCATAATIVSGAMAERTKFSAYCVYSAIISLIIYPIAGHWVWGGGWLAQLGFHDFAGSAVVHMLGGVCALVGAIVLGPRIGKYTKDGKPKAIPGHSITLGALGVFILWFCWFGFNGASTVGMTDGNAIIASRVFVTTNLAAAVATVTTMIITWVRYKKPDVSMTLNGTLAGLVAITAGCDVVSPLGAAAIGIISGFVVVFGIELLDKVLKVDDPVGAVGVHFANGLFGTLATAIFATSESLEEMEITRGKFFGVQLLGVVALIAFAGGLITITFLVIKKTMGLRVAPQEELSGLDLPEHGLASAYADFMPSPQVMGVGDFKMPKDYKKDVVVSKDEAIPVQLKTPEKSMVSDVKLTKIDILLKEERFEALKEALTEIGITGMTVTHVVGCGVQKGKPEYYRGVMREIQLLPRVQVEIVVAKVPVQQVIDVAKKVLYTGHIGDGKIFIYDVENVIKVRTGEEGFDALQDEE